MSAKKTRPRLIKLDLTQVDKNALANAQNPTEVSESMDASPSIQLAPALQDLSNFKKDVQLQDLNLIQEIGSGNGGTVYKVLHKGTNSIMALKVIHVDANNKVRKQILRELQILHDCQSPFIVGYYGAFLDKGNISLCMEFMNAGALDTILAQFGPVSELIAGKVAYSVLEGLVYLFERHRIIHRDIKPSNILVNSMGHIKIADFGVSGELTSTLANTFVGTSAYMSPERIQGKQYSVQCDVWSLGLTLLEIVTGRFPFNHGEDKPLAIFELLQYIVNETVPRPPPGVFSQEFDEFITKSLIKDHDTRPTPQQLLLTDGFIMRSRDMFVDVKAWANQLLGQF